MTLAASQTYVSSRWFYVWMAWACAAVAFVGFTPTYWAPVASGSYTGPAILHIHGLLFSGWVLFFIVQTTLAATDRIRHHRIVGTFGALLALAMLIAGIFAAANSIRVGTAGGLQQTNETFSIVPLSTVSFFVIIVGCAIANVTHPETHKRLMLVATIAILPPAIARLLALASGVPIGPGHPPPILLSLVPSAAADLLLLVAVVRDRRTLGLVHPAYAYAGAALVFLQIVRVPIGMTAAWQSFAGWLASVAS